MRALNQRMVARASCIRVSVVMAIVSVSMSNGSSTLTIGLCAQPWQCLNGQPGRFQSILDEISPAASGLVVHKAWVRNQKSAHEITSRHFKPLHPPPSSSACSRSSSSRTGNRSDTRKDGDQTCYHPAYKSPNTARASLWSSCAC
jgi:hypothetical protein